MSSTSRTHRKLSRTRTQTHSPRFELLEERRLFCALHVPQGPVTELTAKEFTGGTLSVSGGNDADIIWSNRATTITTGPTDTDGFGATFGTSAPVVRAVVDAVITQYERVIGSFNYGAPGGYELLVTAGAPGTGFGGGATLTHSFAGKPARGLLEIGGGTNTPDLNDSNGWFIDGSPFDHVEFGGTIVNAFAADAAAGSIAAGKSDFYTVVAAEMTHCMGLFGSVLPGFGNLTANTFIADNAEGQGTGNFWVFNGPSIKHLMTSNNAGPAIFGGTDTGMAIHGAGSGGNINFGGFNYRGAEDQGNAVYETGRRYLVSEIYGLMFKDAYGYSNNPAATWGTFYSNLDSATKQVTVRGGDFASGQANSNDIINITRTGNTISISVDAGNDVPGSGALPGVGNLPAWVSQYDASQVDFIDINTGAGDDVISVAANVGKQVNVDGSTGNDVVKFVDPLSGVPMIATAPGMGNGITTVSFFGNVESAEMVGNANPTTFITGGTAAGRPLTITGGTADDLFQLTQVNANYLAPVTIGDLGGAFTGNDVLWIDDSITGGNSQYFIGGTQVTKNNGFAGLTFSNVDRINVTGESGNNSFLVTTANLTPVYINGGASFDTYNVETSSTNRPIYIESGAGDDTLNINLDNTGQALAYVQNSTRFGAINVGAFGRLDVLAGTNSTVTATSISTHPQGSINLFDNDFILDYTGASQLANVQALINAGRAAGWVGTGIVSFAARNNPLHNTTLGAMEATDYKSIYGPAATFNGQTIDNTAVAVKYTYYGDADFNGTVNFDDYSRTDSGFNFGRTGWINGDFDGNGSVNFDDYSLIDLAFNTQSGVLRPGLPSLGGKSGKGIAVR